MAEIQDTAMTSGVVEAVEALISLKGTLILSFLFSFYTMHVMLMSSTIRF